MKQEKFCNYIGVGNLDNNNKVTLVYDPKGNTLYLARTELKLPILPTGLGVAISTILYAYFKNKEALGLYPLFLSWGIGLTIGYLVARAFLSIPVTLCQFDRHRLNLVAFLLEQKKAIKKLWGVFSFMLGLTLFSACIYCFTNDSVFLLVTGVGSCTLPLIYFTGLHRRGGIIDRLLKEEGEGG